MDEKKLLEVFKLAGKVLHVELGKDKDGKSRGFGVVEYDRSSSRISTSYINAS